MKNQDAIVCPVTGQPVMWSGENHARAGDLAYPVVHGVPVLVCATSVSAAEEGLPDPVISSLLEALSLGEASRSEIDSVFKNKFKFPQGWMQIRLARS